MEYKLSKKYDEYLPKIMGPNPVKLEEELLQGHRCQSDGDLFPGGKEHVHFAGIWHVADLIRAVCEIVGHAGWCGDNDNDVVAFALGLGDVLCHCFDAIGISDRGAAVFLYN